MNLIAYYLIASLVYAASCEETYWIRLESKYPAVNNLYLFNTSRDFGLVTPVKPEFPNSRISKNTTQFLSSTVFEIKKNYLSYKNKEWYTTCRSDSNEYWVVDFNKIHSEVDQTRRRCFPARLVLEPEL